MRCGISDIHLVNHLNTCPCPSQINRNHLKLTQTKDRTKTGEEEHKNKNQKSTTQILMSRGQEVVRASIPMNFSSSQDLVTRVEI